MALSGWVGDRDAWSQALVRFSCSDGSTVEATTGADGRYTTTLPVGALPCLVHAQGTGAAVLWSAATAAGHANVTTLSNAAVARALRLAPPVLYDSPALARRLTPAQLTQAQADLNAAVAALDLGNLNAAITTPVAANASSDALVRAQGRLLDQLAARDITLGSFNYALAHGNAPAELSKALAQGDRRRLLALPLVGAEGVMPQLVRRDVNTLAGSSSQALLLADDLTFRSADGGRTWLPQDTMLDSVIDYKGALVGAGPAGLVRSTDGGITWMKLQTPAVTEVGSLGIGPDLRLWWMRWTSNQESAGPAALVSDDGIHWSPASLSDGVRDALLFQLYRLPPRRSLIQEYGQPLRACLAASCIDVGPASWGGLHRVHGSDEAVAWMPSGSPGISVDGLQWNALTGPEVWADGMLRTGQGRLLALERNEPSVSDDNGSSWQALSTAPGKAWQPSSTGTLQREALGGGLEMSVDGGQRWNAVPHSSIYNGELAPDGSRLRIKAGDTGSERQIEFSADGGQSWTATALPNGVRTIAWLGDRWGAITTFSQLYVSHDGRRWTEAGKVPSFIAESSFTGANGVWVVGWRSAPSLFPHSLYESADEGKTWTEIFPMAYLGEAATRRAFTCGGALFGTGHEFAVRKHNGWKALPASRCTHDLLITLDGTRVSADHGDTWNPLPQGRARTATVFDGKDWWSLGRASLTLWPH